MKYTFFLIPILFWGLTNQTTKDDGCYKNGNYFSTPNYDIEVFIKEEYRTLFDSIISKPLNDYLCETKINNLPKAKGLRKKRNGASYAFEPQFINLANFNGIYAQRIFYARTTMSVRYFCGWNHYLCLIADDTYYKLTDDSTYNAQLIETHLSNDFAQREIDMMKQFYDDNVICDHYTYLPVYFIRDDDEIIFDAFD